MLLEYISDMFFVFAALIGGIVAIAYVFMKKPRKRRIR